MCAFVFHKVSIVIFKFCVGVILRSVWGFTP